MNLRHLVIPAMTAALLLGCGDDEPPETDTDTQSILVPPPAFPASDSAQVQDVGQGSSSLTRSADQMTATAVLEGQAPGNVLVYSTITFNFPEFCVEGDPRLPVAGPCRGNGPTDPRDAAIPDVRFSADTWASVVVDDQGEAEFAIDFVADAPIERINGGPGIVNPAGAVVFVSILDKGAPIAGGPLAGAQTGSFYGGCQGPPANGPLPCRMVALVQHLP